jgi:hypothetical protein
MQEKVEPKKYPDKTNKTDISYDTEPYLVVSRNLIVKIIFNLLISLDYS